MSRATVILTMLAALIGVGCEGTTKMGTVYKIRPGWELVTYFPGELDDIHKVAGEVVRDDLGYNVEKDAIDAREAAVIGKTALDHPVRVKMYKHGPKTTKISVYVGGPSSEAAAREILDRIEAQLE